MKYFRKTNKPFVNKGQKLKKWEHFFGKFLGKKILFCPLKTHPGFKIFLCGKKWGSPPGGPKSGAKKKKKKTYTLSTYKTPGK